MGQHYNAITNPHDPYDIISINPGEEIDDAFRFVQQCTQTPDGIIIICVSFAPLKHLSPESALRCYRRVWRRFAVEWLGRSRMRAWRLTNVRMSEERKPFLSFEWSRISPSLLLLLLLLLLPQIEWRIYKGCLAEYVITLDLTEFVRWNGLDSVEECTICSGGYFFSLCASRSHQYCGD